MPVFYRLSQSKRDDKTKGKWYAVAVSMGTADLDYLANQVQKNVSMKRSDVYAVVKEFMEQLPIALQQGYTVDLDDLGLMRIGISTTGTDTKEEWDTSYVKDMHICYQDKRRKDTSSGRYTRSFASNLTVAPLPIVVKAQRKATTTTEP